MLQITKGLTTSLFIPVGYINDNAGNLSRSAFAWDAGDIVTVKLIHGKNILGYSGTTSDKGVTFTLSGDEVGTFKVTLTVERGGVEHVCTVDRLLIADEITSNRNTLGGVYFYAQNDALQFVQAYGDNGKPAIISDVNAVATNGGGGGGGATLVPITYAELVAARDNGQLIAGAMYRITDYATTTTQVGTTAAGHDFDIIVTALDAHTLSDDAHAIQHDGDEYFNGSNLAAWRLRYCLDNDLDRFAWAGGDTPARWRVVVDGEPWDYVRAKSHDNDGDDPEYPYAWAYDDDGEIDEYDLMFTQNELPAVGDIAVQDGNEYEITSVTPPQEGNGKGVVYYMRDEIGNECPYDFKNIMFTLVEGGDPLYTFVGNDTYGVLDTTLLGYCANNVIKPCFDGKKQVLNRIVIYNNANNCYIGHDCSNIVLGDFPYNGAQSVKIEDYCTSIIIETECEFINIGAACDNIHFTGDLYARYIDICSATSSIILACAEETSPYNYAQNIVITHGVGVGGDEDNPKTITIPHAGAQYTTTIGRATDVKIDV